MRNLSKIHPLPSGVNGHISRGELTVLLVTGMEESLKSSYCAVAVVESGTSG